jgi:hypothetical protein
MNKLLGYFCLLILTFNIIQCSEIEEESFFKDKESQIISERIIKGELEIVNQVSLYDQFEIFNAIGLILDGNTLFIADRPQLKVIGINTGSFELDHSFTIPEGEGPEELTRISPNSVSNDTFVFYDRSLSKFQFRDINGTFIHEFIYEEIHPSRIRFLSNGNFVTLSDPYSTGQNFMFHEMNQKGEILSEFGEIDSDHFHTLMYPGSIVIDENDNFYYAGFSEHILKKWDPDYHQLFSIASIDDFPAELNYVTFESGGDRVFGYSEHGYFSSIGSALYNDFWLILHGGVSVDEHEYPKLDIYNRETGDYLYTYEIPYRTDHLAVDDQYIYMLHIIDGDSHLVIYENILP